MGAKIWTEEMQKFLDDNRGMAVKKMAKKLGTHLTKINKDSDGKVLEHPIFGFSGDHRENIMHALIEEKIPNI